MSTLSKQRRQMKNMERISESVIYNSRWVLVPVFLALALALVGFAIHFVSMVGIFIVDLFSYQKNDLLLMLLTFVDKVLVGGLIVMVLIGGYENFVGKIDVSDKRNKLSWLGKVGSGSLKIKLSTSIVSISSIHLLKMFLDISSYSSAELAWTSGIHFMMVVTALLLVWMDKIQPSK